VRLVSRRPAVAGLTLMEVLVAMALLSLLSAAILTALRVGASAWETANTNLMLDRRIASANAIFHAALEGMTPVFAEFESRETGPATVVFFQGHPQSMRFVSAYSLEAGPRAGLRILELEVVEGPRGRRVLLNDLPYLDPRQAGRFISGAQYDPQAGAVRLVFAPIQALPNSFIIADELEGCAFAYYLEERGPEPSGRWLAVWDRLDELPRAVTIQIAARPDSARLRPVSITVPIRSRLRPL
jgi:prepilin-type N-terminal cleavage/methylation domain-containing protein